MLYGEEVGVCSEINTKHTNIEGENLLTLSFKPVGGCNH
jgi:hypothetical protein